MRKLAIAATLSFLAVSTPLLADKPTDGNELRAGCQLAVAGFDRPANNVTPADALRTGLCIGFLDGVAGAHFKDTLRSAEAGKLVPAAFCIPTDVTLRQEARALLAFLAAHPERLSEDAVTLVYAAFAAAWPCPVIEAK